MTRLRVLVVDDSAFMRGAIARLLASDARFEVVGQAKDGSEAVSLASSLAPDVVTMDYNMPGMNGAEATRAILGQRPVPIVMLSAHTHEGAAATVEALAAGAVDFVTKPGGEVSANLAPLKDELFAKLVASAGAKPRAVRALSTEVAPPPVSRRAPLSVTFPAGLRVVVIAASTGGPSALIEMAPKLQSGANAAVLVVQHMPAGFTAALARQLRDASELRFEEARGGERLDAGTALVAAGNRHLVIAPGGTVRLNDEQLVHGVRPAADVTLKSAATAFGGRVIGVVLTGMGRDGAAGLAAVKAAGGRTLAQDKGTSVVYGMPRAAAELGVVDEVLPLERIGSRLAELVG